MKKTLYLSLIAILISFTGNAQSKTFETEKGKIVYHLNQGRFNDLYTSYYFNGNKKAEGHFADNTRVGKWIIWDENGNVIVEREYESSFTFSQNIPKNEDIATYNLERNEDGVIPFFFIKEENVDWLQRVWRSIPMENNPVLFDDNRVFQLIHEGLIKGEINGYSPETDIFKEELIPSDIDFASNEVLSYKIKEESFFDNKRMVMESRILGICPVVLDRETGKPKELVWIYYPQFRKLLARLPVPDGQVPDYIRSAEDVFFYRYFSSQIIKVSNLHDQYIEDYKSDSEIEEEATKFELRLIEREHEFWVK